jgi:recombination protein RecR
MDSFTRLVEALRCLPGVGPKSAQRMVFHLLQNKRDKGLFLASCLEEAMRSIASCHHCNNYTTAKLCKLCANPSRDPTLLCIVESPADVSAIEQSQTYNGLYFVLMQKISPLDGIGPEDIGLPKLDQLFQNGAIQEVILALSPTIEGQTTEHFIRELLNKTSIKVTQLARGIPLGSELEYLDINTIGNALKNRSPFI